MKPLAPE
jgi:hypothetical protein